MRLIWKAVRAAAVETMGVVAVIWMLLAGAGMTVESAGVETAQEASQAWQWVTGQASRATRAMTPSLEGDERHEYVQQRLDHYGQMYQSAATNYVQEAVGKF